jgi:hypothetical protein
MSSPKALLLAGAWSLLLILRFGFAHELYQYLWVGMFAVDAALLVSGMIAIWSLVEAVPRSRSRQNVVALAGVLSLIGVAYGSDVLKDAGTYFRFLRLRSGYTEIVSHLQAGTIAADGMRDGISYQSAAGLELRIAFRWGGTLDNWSGVVYDPTGLVMQSNEFLPDWSNWLEPELAQVKGLFGGDLRAAQHLQGHWYFCLFT